MTPASTSARRWQGLCNMDSRAQRIGMRFDIDSALGCGTRVTLELPAAQAVPLAAG